jgi:predicted phosphodiesterase
MNILVISDLHIGPEDRYDTFGWSSREFIATLDLLREEHEIDRVVLNGDIFELYRYTYIDILANRPDLIRYFKDPAMIYIRGNHDFANDFARDHLLIRNQAGKTVFIEHGHNADFINGTRLGRILGFFSFKILKLLVRSEFFHRRYLRFLEKDSQINHIPRRYNSYPYLRYALQRLKEFDVVILGHTHKIETHKTYYLNQKKIYLNTGSCSLGRFQGVLLNTATLEYEIIHTHPNQLRLVKGRNDEPVAV